MNGMRAIVKNMGLVILFIVSLLLSVSCDDEDITRSPQVGSVDFQFELYDAEGNPYIVDALPSGTFHVCSKRPDMIATSWINNEVMIVSENMIGHLSYWWFVNGESSSDEPSPLNSVLCPTFCLMNPASNTWTYRLERMLRQLMTEETTSLYRGRQTGLMSCMSGTRSCHLNI